MISLCLSGGFCVSVERFSVALSLFCLPVAGGWIEGRGEIGQWREGRGNGAGSAWNGGQGISNLLFGVFSSLIFNGCLFHYLGCIWIENDQRGIGGAFEQGGEGAAGAARRRSLQSISAVKIYQHCHQSPAGLKKQKKGVGHV